MSSAAMHTAGPDLICANHRLAALEAAERVRWGLSNLPGPHVLTSSFGAQSAVMLHLVTRQRPDIPVLLVDTGYLFPETYRFVDALTDRLDLNLQVCRPRHSAAWQEARHGRLWEAGSEGLAHYNRIHKIEPLQRAFDAMGVQTWFAGLRRDQGPSRRDLAYLARSERYKLLPILDWTDRQIFDYLRAHELPYHPLWDQGYVSIGDWHTTRSLADVDDPSELRFHGIKRECGIHEEL